MTDKNTAANTPISQNEERGYMGYKLEIGKHTFKERILKNCIYVDKTQHIYELMSRDSNCFLSRPRRFGKSGACQKTGFIGGKLPLEFIVKYSGLSEEEIKGL